MYPDVKTKRFTARLPATPCTEEMRDSVISLANKNHMTVAELHRHMLHFFLSDDAKLFDISRQEITHEGGDPEPIAS